MFRDQEYSQIIGQRKFDEMQESLFANMTAVNGCNTLGQSLCNITEENVDKNWPERIHEIAPFEQHKAALQTMFALDCVIRSIYTESNCRYQQ